MTPEVAAALAARLVMACSACGESLAGYVDAEGRCSECTGENIGVCEWCSEIGYRDREDRCFDCSHCDECGDALDGTDPPFCSDACEDAMREKLRADEWGYER